MQVSWLMIYSYNSPSHSIYSGHLTATVALTVIPMLQIMSATNQLQWRDRSGIKPDSLLASYKEEHKICISIHYYYIRLIFLSQ